MAAVALLQTPNYPTRFRGGIMRAIQYVLTRIQQAKTGLVPKDKDHALHTLSYALGYDEAWPVARDLLLTIAPKMEQAGHRDDWMAYLERGIEQSQKLGDVEAEAELRFQLGILYQYLSKLVAAQHQFESSAQLFSQLANSHHQARALNRLAAVERRQRHFEEATRLVETALELVGEAKEEQAYSYLELGFIAYDQRDWEKALHFFSKSLTLWELTNNRRLIAWSLNNLAMTLQKLKRDSGAIKSYQKAIKLFEMIQDPVYEAAARMNLGNVYLVNERFKEALNLYALADPVFHKTQAFLYLAMVNNNKGIAYRKLQSWDKAKHFYKVSIELWQREGNISALVNVMDGLGLVYLGEARYDKAIVTFQDALDWLSKIKDEPSYEHLYAIVTTHLREAIVKRS